MKKILLVAGLLLAFNLNSQAFADEAHPCKVLETACKAAGYYKGGNVVGKGLYKDCIEALTEGKAVAGVKVNKLDIAACKVKIAKMQADNAGVH